MGSVLQSNKVIIIGAGLGGLALAQILQHNNVPFDIFERDSELHARKQGWAVAIVESVTSVGVLAKRLPLNSVNVNTGDLDEIAFVNAATGEKVGSVGGQPLGQPGYFIRTSREGFREFLWDLDGRAVNTNKKFNHFVQDAEKVTAHFSDGSTATGSLLIGADGAHSSVLDQLVGKDNHKPKLSALVPVFGEADVPPHIYEPIRKLGNAVILATAPGVHIQIGMMSMKKDRSTAHFFWAIMPRREQPQELSDWVQHANKQDLYDFSVECTKNLHPFVKDLVTFGGVGAIVQQARFLEFEPPEHIPDGRVSILGDAAHSMIPFRAAGANTAILDACDLGRLLVQAHKEGKDFSTVLPKFHETMIPRGTEAVRSSHAAGEADEKQWAKMFRRDK